MAGGIRQRNLQSDWRICGVYSSAANYLIGRNVTSASEGDIYFDTDLNILRTYDGSNWSPAGQNSASPGAWDNVCQIGAKVTNTDQLEVERSYASGAIFVLDQNNTGASARCLNLENASNDSASITLDFASTNGYDIDGSNSSSWYVEYDGDAMFHSIWLKDSINLMFGSASGGDVTIDFVDAVAPGTAGGGLMIQGVSTAEQIQFGTSDAAMDLLMIGTTSANYCHWDASANELILEGSDLGLQDDDQLLLGNSDDVMIDWETGGNFQVTPLTNNSDFTIGTTTAAWDIRIYGDTATSILHWDSQYDRLIFESAAGSADVMCQFDDYVQVTFGTGTSFGVTGSGDVQMSFNGTDFLLAATAADEGFKIGDTSTGFDITYYFEGSGKTITTDYDGDVLTMDGCDLAIGDNDYILLGDSAAVGGAVDGTIRWDTSSASPVLEIIGNTQFEDNVQIDGNLVLSGSLTHSGSFNPGSLHLDDSENLLFGSATNGDVSIDFVDGGTIGTQGYGLLIAGVAADEQLQIGNSSYHWDVIFVGASAAQYLHWDASANELILEGADIGMQDDDGIIFGNSDDFVLDCDSTLTRLNVVAAVTNTAFAVGDAATNIDFICVSTGDTLANLIFDASHDGNIGGLLLGADDHGLDVQFYGASTGKIVDWDQSGDIWNFGKNGTGVDVNFYSDTAGDKILFDENKDTNGALIFTDCELIFDPTTSAGNVDYTFGPADTYSVADALQLRNTDHTAAMLVLGSTGTNGMDIIFQGATNTADRMKFDAGALSMTLSDVDLIFDPTTSHGNVNYTLGGSDTYGIADGLQLRHTDHTAANLILGSTGTNGLNIIFQGSTCTGVRETFDAAALTHTFSDIGLVFSPTQTGANVDYTIIGDLQTTDSLVLKATDHTAAQLILGTTGTNGMNVVFQGASSTAERITFDAGALTNTYADVSLCFYPSISGALTYTLGGDTATTSALLFSASDSAAALLTFGTTGTNGLDVIFQGATSASEKITFDAGALTDTYADIGLVFAPTITGGSVSYTIVGDTATTGALNFSATDSGAALLRFGSTGTNGMDIVFQGATSVGVTETFDAAALTHTFADIGLVFKPTQTGALSYTILGDPATTSALQWSASDSAAALLRFGSTGTNGMDVVFQGATTVAATLKWDAATQLLTAAADTEIVTTISSTDTDGKGLRVPVSGNAPTATAAAAGSFLSTSGFLYVKYAAGNNWLKVAIAS